MQVTARQRKVSSWGWALVDMSCWALAIFVATWLRLDFDTLRTLGVGTLEFAVAAAAFHFAAGMVIGPYAVGHVLGSFEEVVDIGRAVLLTTFVKICGDHLSRR